MNWDVFLRRMVMTALAILLWAAVVAVSVSYGSIIEWMEKWA